jgi:hypothetical protein
MSADRAETDLARDVLPHFRTRAELYRRGPARAYAAEAGEGVTALREAADRLGARPVIPYVQRAITSTVRVILRADDSDGVIGDVSGSCSACTPSSARPIHRRRRSSSAG